MNERTIAVPNFSEATAILAADPIANVYVAFSNPKAGFRCRLYRLAMKQELADRFVRSAWTFLDGLNSELAAGDLSFQPYDPSTEAAHDEVEWVRVEEIDILAGSVEALSSGAAIETLNTKGELPGKPIFSVVSLTAIDEKNCVNMFQPFTMAHELSHRGIVAALFDGAFNAIEEKIFLFEDKWSVLSIGDHAFVIARPGFERMFDLGKAVLSRKDAITKAIVDVVPLVDPAPFIAYCAARQRVLQKLEMISRRSYFKGIDISRIKAAITLGNLTIEVVEAEGKISLVCTKDNVKDIVDLLNDDILRSLGISDQNYRVRSKRQI